MRKIKFISILVILCMFLFSGIAIAQDATSDSEATAGAAAINDQTFEATKGFSIAPQMTYSYIPNVYDKATPTCEFQPMKEVAFFKYQWTRKELKELGFNRGITAEARMITKVIKTTISSKKDNDTIQIIFKKPEGAQLLGFITVRATSNDKSSIGCFADAAILALNYEGSKLYVASEGARRVVTALGWGVGFSYSYARMGQSGEDCGIGTGGFGVSGGEAGYKHKPWIRFAVLK